MRKSSPYKGKTVKLRADISGIGGQDFEVADWFENAARKSWREALDGGDFRAVGYSVRRGLAGLPDDDRVLIGRVDGVMQIVHVSEIEGADPDPEPAEPVRQPKPVDERAVGQNCPACGVPLAAGDMVAVVVLGPGADPAARAAARGRLPYNAVAVEIHWACATGDEVSTITGKKRG